MENYNKVKSEHMDWLDLLKIGAAFLVVLQHSISGIWTSLLPNTITWKIINFLFILSRSSVPVFFMCSGAGMLCKQRSISDVIKKNIFQLIKLYISWMLFYGFIASISLVDEGLASFSTIRNAFIKEVIFGEYFTWFIFALIGLYLITPFLSVIIQNKQLLQYFIALSVLFTIIIPLTGYFPCLNRLTENLNNFHMHFVVGYVLYYVLGYYISQMDWKKQYTIITIILFAISYIAAFLFSCFHSIQKGMASQEIYGEFMPLGFLINLSVFALFKAFSKYISSNGFSRKLVHYGIGVYLMHPLFLGNMVYFNDLYRILGAVLLYLVCVLICVLIDKSKLLSKLFLK